VGEHGNIRIEDADWNDGMDMAKEKGETVAFTALYAGNLLKLANTLTYLHDQGIKSINVLKEAMILFDTIDSPIDYHNISAKLHILNSYFEAIKRGVSGESVNLPIELLIHDLKAKHDFFYQHLNEQEWMEGPQVDEGWFNGYYDNRSHRLESTDERNIRMTLTGQTFTLMSQMASVPQIAKIIHSVNRHLMDPTIGIPRLNTDFQENTMKMGRFMGFAYGHKENGSMFSHMAVMYAYSLFENDFVEDGRAIIDNIYHYMSEVDKAKILPGIPEYIDSEGRGMYHYLTGSASWMLLTYIEQIFGLKGYFGDLVVQPRLQANDFKAGYEVKINTLINAHLCEIIFKNPDQLDYRQYQIHKVNDKIINAPHFTIKKNEVTEPMTFVIVLGGK
jgi:cellobiose phosphorylase